MNNSHRNGAVDSEALARARYAAYAQRRTMPPRCNPIGILLLVLTLGTLFIGLTMTIIANWPGATSIGENPLRVAGPVLLGCGGVFFLLTVVLIVLMNNREQTKWERQLTDLAADRFNNSSREVLVVTQNQPSAFVDDPYKIRSRTSQGDQEVTSSQSSGAYPVKARYNVNMSPDPAGKFKQTAKLHDVSLDSDDKVPDPTRVQKKRPTSHKKYDGSNALFNNSYSSGTGEADLGIPDHLIPSGHRPSQEASSPSGGYHNASFESAERTVAESGSGPRNEAGQRKSRAAEERGKREDTGRRGVVQGASSHVLGDVGRATAYSEYPQKLRVHIKAQSGMAVHITPTAIPPSTRHSHQMAGRKSLDTSGETEI